MRRGVVLAVLAGLAITGCGDVSPGAAATVDGTTISLDTVDEIAQSVCTAEVTFAGLNEQEWQPTPTSGYRDNVLTLLVNQKLADEVVEEMNLDVPPSQYEAPEDPQLTDIFEAMPAEEREPFERYLDVFAELQAAYVAIYVARGGAEPTTTEQRQRAVEEGQRYVADFAEDRDIDLDPRFGDFTGGQVVGGSGSLSVAVDDSAAETSPEEQPDVSGLPDSQICQ